MEPRACQVKAQLRPLGRPAISTLSNYSHRYTQKTSKLTHKYLARGFICMVFGINVLLYAVTVLTLEIFSITVFLGYQLYLRAEQKLGDNKYNAIKAQECSQPKKTPSTQSITLMGVEFAPADVPFGRRLQTIAVSFCAFSFIFAGSLFTFFTFSLLFTKLYWVILLYAAWYLYDFRTHEQGGHRVHWFRHWRFWATASEYFPIRLVKTADLPADRNYIMGVHPHGIMAAGSFCNFATEATGFAKLFPGISPHLMTLTLNFFFPLYRDIILALGVVSVSRKSLEWILKMKGLGNAAVIVVGGASEALDAHRNTDVALTLTSRKGFIKMALLNGADLVPVFSFGENDIFDQAANPPGSKLRNLQLRFKELIGFSPPMFYGRGLFQYTCGTVPYRQQVTTVVGAPIAVKQKANPSQEDIDELHAKYVEALKELFETHKATHGCNPEQTLTIY